MTTLHLTGLRGHHPMGFLAACGTLSLTTQVKGNEGALLNWRLQADGWQPCLTTVSSDVNEIIGRLKERSIDASISRSWNWSNKINDVEKFRQQARTSIHQREQLVLDALAAQASDLVQHKGTLESTLFDLTSGNQSFLSSITDIAQRLSHDSFREALLGPWTYSDDAHSLGWDPQSQRLHALRHKLPEKDKANRSVRAAVFLASQALSLFPCFAVSGKLRTTGFLHDNGNDWFSWPIWDQPISLNTLRSLVAQPRTTDLKRRGVKLFYRCRRVRTGGSEGNYQVFSNAEEYFPAL